jgi:hypothetical protein
VGYCVIRAIHLNIGNTVIVIGDAMRATQHIQESIVYRLYAHNTGDKDIWATKGLKQNVKYWMNTMFKHDVSCVSYIPVNIIIDQLKRDLEKLKALRVLDVPSRSFKSEMGSDVYGAGDFEDETASIDTLVNYITNMIEILNNAKKLDDVNVM